MVEKALYAMLLLPYFKCSSFVHISTVLDTLFDIMKVLSMACVFVLYLLQLRKRRKSLDGALVFTILYEIAFVSSTLLNEGDLWTTVLEAGGYVFICLLIAMMIRQDTLLCMDVLLLLLELWIYINFATMLLYPKGMYTVWGDPNKFWFLGHKNLIIPYAFPACWMAICRSYFRLGKLRITLRMMILFSISLLSVFLANSSTAIMGLLLFLFLLLVTLRKQTHVKLNARVYLIANVVFFIIIILLRLQDVFEPLISGFFGKNITFTGRTLVWDAYLYQIASKPIWGCGVSTNGIHLLNGFVAVHAHNMYINVLYRGGIVAFIPFLGLLILSTYKMMKYRNHKIARTLAAAFCGMLLMWQMEVYYAPAYWCFFTFAFYLDEIIAQQQKRFIRAHAVPYGVNKHENN